MYKVFIQTTRHGQDYKEGCREVRWKGFFLITEYGWGCISPRGSGSCKKQLLLGRSARLSADGPVSGVDGPDGQDGPQGDVLVVRRAFARTARWMAPMARTDPKAVGGIDSDQSLMRVGRVDAPRPLRTDCLATS